MNAELTVALKLNRCCSGNHGVIPARPVRRGLRGSFPACRQAGLVLFLPVPLIAGEKQKRTTNKLKYLSKAYAADESILLHITLYFSRL